MAVTYKGILLAGGAGTRLYPATAVYNKHLVVLYDKPLIYYPLSTLMMTDIREVLIIAGPETLPLYQKLFGDGSHLGMTIQYAEQEKPRGIAESLLIGERFIGTDGVVLILGDNVFHGYMDDIRTAVLLNAGATVFAYWVRDPERYGVVEFNESGKAISIEEKPAHPKSNYAVPGLYVYDNDAVRRTKALTPSPRGELEITDLNKSYMADESLLAERLGRGFVWLDAGTPQALLEASMFIGTIEARQGLKVGCPEEIALRRGFISMEQFRDVYEAMPNCSYADYLRMVGKENMSC